MRKYKALSLGLICTLISPLISFKQVSAAENKTITIEISKNTKEELPQTIKYNKDGWKGTLKREGGRDV